MALADPDLAGIHFTGSTPVFQRLWKQVGENIASYQSYPRHRRRDRRQGLHRRPPVSADIDVLRTAMVRGAFEYQGQKCSAASRAYVPRSIWDQAARRPRVAETDVAHRWATSPTCPTSWAPSSTTARSPSTRRRSTGPSATTRITVVAGGTYDDSEGWFVRPTVLESTDPDNEIFTTEYFGPILGVHVYEDADYDAMLRPDGVGGAVRADRLDHRPGPARRRRARSEYLRFAAGNFYVNDKPTGAVVGQQPFGGARASGTNDKAGAPQNLMRWTSTRSIKETLVPPTDYRYPHMG